jgi:hypothetical protein
MRQLRALRDAVVSLLRAIWKAILSLPIWLGLVRDVSKEARLRKLIEEPEDRQKIFIDEEWLGNLLEVDKRAHGYKSMYYILRFVAVVGGVLLPFFAVGGRNPEVTSLLSVVVAASVGWEAAFAYGEKWQLFRRMSALLEHEGVRFLSRLPPGQSTTDEPAFQAFVRRVERILKQKVEGYTAIVERARSKETTQKAGEGDDDSGSSSETPPSPKVRPAPKPRKSQ